MEKIDCPENCAREKERGKIASSMFSSVRESVRSDLREKNAVGHVLRGV